MATEHDQRSHNQPSQEAQVEGGQHSHQGPKFQRGSQESAGGQPEQGTAGKTPATKEVGRSHNQPSHEAQVKGGQHSHSGSKK